MNQDQRLQAVLEKVSGLLPLREVAVDADISDNSAFLKLVNVSCHNWTAGKLSRIGALRMTVKIPALDALTIIFYPQENTDAPIFLLFFLITGRKVISHFNVCTPFDDENYLNKWVKPLDGILAAYPEFECMDRYPDWMKQYQHDSTIYGLFKQDKLADLTACSFEFLDHYLQLVAASDVVTNTDQLAHIASFHEKFKTDIRTRDKAQGMTSKFIGKEKARRIFYEVVT
ncbi:hypothetical protein [Oceanicoccus sp. KOV_DT_Chl]|uniref:hypothetical protein n=1 Tax=Oceanicoccus sp. KOV_DT_Chl TaxID=1904639 RepID=UPI000C7DEA09|nr:hypothetical protein [Oceanicoccus sp. KOV_DT_Chl]